MTSELERKMYKFLTEKIYDFIREHHGEAVDLKTIADKFPPFSEADAYEYVKRLYKNALVDLEVTIKVKPLNLHDELDKAVSHLPDTPENKRARYMEKDRFIKDRRESSFPNLSDELSR